MSYPQNNATDPFTFAGEHKNFTLGDFWRWNAARIMSNITRSHLAEFIVAHALGIADEGPLEEWSSHDLLFEGKRIEIKASAYIQEWDQPANTNPRFSIQAARKLEPCGRYGNEVQRNSDMYIFCIFTEKDRSAVKQNLLCLDKWEFYPVLTSEINTRLGNQKSVGMGTICKLCPEPAGYESLREIVAELFGIGIKK